MKTYHQRLHKYLCENLLIDAVAARDRGLLGFTDYQILQYAFEEERIIITANVCDFERFARSCELHAGIVFIRNGALLRNEQIAVVEKAINAITNELESGRDMINRVLYIELDNTMIFETLPPTL
ncbi:hypothetical protein DSM106972_089620 [Dulcicalothrix desertica PCC 7102]|uniref:DUF5615 domain-containing protein n=1 Tax=Dulcicalothrix desertica PCC 7102 TaxID=232991 RepID=A0A433UP54_9CYAN|nr:DUF5615 family PIN-like protein [Dulcicalothrix desertica]RUS95606.1 hypothetical protein DSM106972_089620 [Dulcicalothrix desertica PCC 7102]TWH39941.1 putative nuclease of predicted toxin-antitoxin system [Dulcicalothrix desertica PCC 7102]